MKKVSLYILGFSIFTVVGIVNYYPLLLTAYAKFFTVSNATKGADAIVVLSGSITTRFPRAVELSKQGYARQILLTQAKPPNMLYKDLGCDEKSVASAIAESLKVKVPVKAVPSLKGGATSTFDEAYDLRHYSRNNHFKHLIIVTDNYHTRRSLYAFKKVFKGTGIRLEALGAENDIFNEADWWQTDTGIQAYVMGGIKYMVYLFTSQNISFVKNN
jgi:uncharacterized SAM-binding protein YcdF (DUF218 family)